MYVQAMEWLLDPRELAHFSRELEHFSRYCDLQNNWRNGFQQFPGSKLVLKTVENRCACVNFILQVAVSKSSFCFTHFFDCVLYSN